MPVLVLYNDYYKKNYQCFCSKYVFKNPGENESLHLVVSELLPKRLVSLDKVCIGPWDTLSMCQSWTQMFMDITGIDLFD